MSKARDEDFLSPFHMPNFIPLGCMAKPLVALIGRLSLQEEEESSIRKVPHLLLQLLLSISPVCLVRMSEGSLLPSLLCPEAPAVQEWCKT